MYLLQSGLFYCLFFRLGLLWCYAIVTGAFSLLASVVYFSKAI